MKLSLKAFLQSLIGVGLQEGLTCDEMAEAFEETARFLRDPVKRRALQSVIRNMQDESTLRRMAGPCLHVVSSSDGEEKP